MTLSRTMRAAAVAVTALSLAATGCGGDDGRLSAEEYREEVNAICARYESELDELGSPQRIEDVPEYVDRAIPLVEQEIEDVRALEPPEELEEDVDRMIAQAEETLAAAEDLREAAEQGDEEGVRGALQRGNEANAEAERIARDLGLDECAN